MNTPHYYLGIDCSTTATKTVAWTSDGRLLAEARAAVPLDSPRPGYAEQDAGEWWQSTCHAVRACLQHVDPRAAAALGITVQRETFVLLNAAHQPVRPAILWYDARAAETFTHIAASVNPEAYHRLTGKQLDVTSALGKLEWLRRYEPEVLAETVFFADVLAYLSWHFTGQLSTTAAGVDTMGLVNLQTGQWHEPYVTASALSMRNLPRLVTPGAELGKITALAAAATGLPEGLPVIAGGGDGHCTSLGAGRCRERNATLGLGTSGVLGIDSGNPVLGADFRTLIACTPHRYLLESVIQCGSETISWLHKTFLGQTMTDETLKHADAMAAEIPPGAEGLLVVPHWRGVRAPHNDADARGAILGWSDHHTVAHLHRAILEGVAFEVAGLLERITTNHDLAVDELVITGGGAASKLWRQIIANAVNLPCLCPATVETAALGAAILARSAREKMPVTTAALQMAQPEIRVLPAPETVTSYRRLRTLHEQVYPLTNTLSHELAAFARGSQDVKA